MTLTKPLLPKIAVPRPASLDAGVGASGIERSAVSRRGTLSGDQLAELLVQHFPKAWRVACRLGLTQAQAEETAQEAFVVLLNRSREIESGKELSFLLSTVARISQNLRRKSSHLREVSGEPDAIESHSVGTTAFDIVERKQACQLVDAMLSRLTDPLRVVFVLYEIERFTLQQIADCLEIPLSTAGSRLRLARQAFEKELERQRLRNKHYAEEP